MNGTIIDCAAIALGGIIGYVANRFFLNREMSDKVMQTLALCAFLVGITGCTDISNPIICIISIVAGGLIGNALALEDRLVGALNRLAGLMARTSVSRKFVEGFISYTLLSIVGSMSIVGAMQNSLNGDITTLMTKSVIDFICAVLFGASFGLSVACSAVVVFLYQGFFALLAVLLTPVLTAGTLGDVSAVGSVLIFIVGLNLLKVSDIKTMNLTPSIFLVILLNYTSGFLWP